MSLNRRHLFGLFGAAGVAASLPKLPPEWLVPETVAPSVATLSAAAGGGKNTLLPLQMITREAVELFQRNNAFMQNLAGYDACFATEEEHG